MDLENVATTGRFDGVVNKQNSSTVELLDHATTVVAGRARFIIRLSTVTL